MALDVTLNGNAIATQAGTLAELVTELYPPDAPIACALNGTFVPASARGETRLSAGDEIEVVSPRQGG